MPGFDVATMKYKTLDAGESAGDHATSVYAHLARRFSVDGPAPAVH